jgi:PAS domain-containing protein
MVSAWFGGAGPGLLAIVVSGIGFYYGFLPPPHSVVSKPAQIPRFLVFVVSAVVVGSLSVAHRWAAQTLRIARDKLSETVQELKKSNDALSRSEAYLAEAQTLSHTGSAGWNVPTGELFWSDETFRIFGYELSFKPTMERVLQRVHPEDLARVQQALEAASHGQKLDIENRSAQLRRTRPGTPPNQGATGFLEGVGAITDITTVKNAFEEIRTLRDQAYLH